MSGLTILHDWGKFNSQRFMIILHADQKYNDLGGQLVEHIAVLATSSQFSQLYFMRIHALEMLNKMMTMMMMI